MAKVELLYGKGRITADLGPDRRYSLLESKAHLYKSDAPQEQIVSEALKNPYGSRQLHELAFGKKNIVIIASDHTRPVPSKIIMPLLLAEIRKGNPDAEITILIATGCHRGMTKAEIKAKFGDEIAEKERIVNHDCDDKGNLTLLGLLPSGGECVINRLAVEADLLVAEGFIEPHFFAGFSGGRKSVLPGVAGRTTVLANHCADFIKDEQARCGVLEGNPIQKDMLYAAREAYLAFICNVAIDSEKKVIAAFAGDMEKAHEKGVAFVSKITSVSPVPADIVLTTNGGYPLDQNIYQAVKGMSTAEATCRKGGVIIICAACEDGHGGEAFYKTFLDATDISAVMQKICGTPPDETLPDQWQSQIFARILLNYHVIMVTDVSGEMVEAMHMKKAATVEAALALADKILMRENSAVTIIPDGVSVIIRQE